MKRKTLRELYSGAFLRWSERCRSREGEYFLGYSRANCANEYRSSIWHFSFPFPLPNNPRAADIQQRIAINTNRLTAIVRAHRCRRNGGENVPGNVLEDHVAHVRGAVT